MQHRWILARVVLRIKSYRPKTIPPMILRMVKPLPSNKRTEAPRCNADGCDRASSEQKPWCPAHIDRAPYVRDVIRVIEWMDETVQQAARGKVSNIDPSGLVCEELLYELVHPKTVPGLAGDLGWPKPAVSAIVRLLEKAGKVTTWKSSRKVIMVSKLPRSDP